MREHDQQHARPQRHDEAVRHVDLERELGAQRALARALVQLAHVRRELREPERDDLATLLELGQEEDVVHQLRHLDDLGAGLLDQLLDVDARQLRGVQQREQPRERRAQLVRDRGREPDAQPLVAARQVLRRSPPHPKRPVTYASVRGSPGS